MVVTRYRGMLRLHGPGNPIGEIAAAAGCQKMGVGWALRGITGKAQPTCMASTALCSMRVRTSWRCVKRLSV